MISFVLLAAALSLVSVVIVAMPLLRRSSAGPGAPWTALAAAGLLVVGSAVWAFWLDPDKHILTG